MVFAVWAARAELPAQDPQPFLDSMRFGLGHIADIARLEHAKVGVSEELARSYLKDNIVFELGDREYAGLKTFLQYASELGITAMQERPAEGRPVEGRRVSV